MAPTKKYSETRPKVQRHHAWWVAIFIAGTLVPPIAVAMRFGITRDFWINCLMMIGGYFPSHGHNYLQNIRDNTGRGRTPQWAINKGLLPVDKIRSQSWKNKYAERTTDNPYDDDDNASIHSARSNRAVAKPASGGGIEAARRNRYHGNDSPYGGSSGNVNGSIPEARDLERNRVDDSDRFSLTRGASSSSTNVDDDDIAPGMERTVQKKKSGGFLGLFGGKKDKKDRFAKEREAREQAAGGMGLNGTQGDDEYADDFERQINGGASRPNDSDRSLTRAGTSSAPRQQAASGDGLNHTF